MRLQRMSDEAIASTLGDVIRERRVRKNISQDQLACDVGVSTPTIQKLEKGRGTIALLVATLRALNCLDLLTDLLAAPRVSPLSVMETGKVQRQRASGATRSARQASNKAMAVEAPRNAENLLIPRKK